MKKWWKRLTQWPGLLFVSVLWTILSLLDLFAWDHIPTGILTAFAACVALVCAGARFVQEREQEEA